MIFCIRVIFLFSFFLFFYNISVWALGSVRGRVLDEERKALEFVNVYLTPLDDSTSLIAGTVSDSTGNFLLANIPLGEYLLHSQSVGYLKRSSTITIVESIPNLDLGTITLQPDIATLQAVNITAFREMIQRTEEGMVVNASENITQIGGTAADLLKNMPGLLVGSEGEINLRGRVPLILINGRVSGIGGVDRTPNLDQIPASSIERIEIILST